jgi:hypothetical protein
MSKVNWEREHEVQATREYLQRKTDRGVENSIKALRARDPKFDALVTKQLRERYSAVRKPKDKEDGR